VDDEALAERRRGSQMAAYRALGTASPGAFWREVRPGVQATVVPACPDKSLPNAVIYTDPAAVLDAHDDLIQLYRDAGVGAWTVWVVPQDDDLAAALERRGHALDGTPSIMVARMDEVDLGEGAAEPALDLDPDPSWPDVGALNDAAYGLAPRTLAPALEGMVDPAMCAFVARLDGRPVAALCTVDGPDGDCALEFVATLPEARGRGLASALVRAGLRAARERGCTSTTLEGSALGEPVYERLGYRTVGRMRMYELRGGV
jgi:GNAT superfamily N-acetyltransferase